MPKSITQAIVLHLADNEGTWFDCFFFEQKEIRGKWTGVEARKRIRELFQPEEQKTTYKIGTVEYSLERRSVGKYAEVRVVGLRDTRQKYEVREENGRRIAVLV